MNYVKGPFKNKKEIVLASRSPRRQQLLSSLGIHFQVFDSKIKETNSANTPEDLVIKNAHKKALSAQKQRVQGVIISADTIVVLNNEVIGKPKHKEDAIFTLQKLSGKWHEVYTGCCILDLSEGKSQLEQFVVKSEVFVDKLDPYIIKAYVETNEPLDKAGSYAIQGVGAFFVKKIKGSYTNIVGLPLNEIVNILLKIDAIGV